MEGRRAGEWEKVTGGLDMISYMPFYGTLARRGMTEYALIFKYRMPANTLHRMKHGEAISTKTLDRLCTILSCEVGDVLEFVPESSVEGTGLEGTGPDMGKALAELLKPEVERYVRDYAEKYLGKHGSDPDENKSGGNGKCPGGMPV